MSEPLYLLMYELGADSRTEHDPRAWFPVTFGEDTRMVPREVAERAAEDAPRPSFLMLARDAHGNLTAAGEQFGGDSQSPMATLPGETIWQYGQPTRIAMMEVLSAAAFAPNPEGAPSPHPEHMPVRISTVVEIATDRIGAADPHDIQTAFDVLVMDLGGTLHDDPPYYGVPLTALGIR